MSLEQHGIVDVSIIAVSGFATVEIAFKMSVLVSSRLMNHVEEGFDRVTDFFLHHHIVSSDHVVVLLVPQCLQCVVYLGLAMAARHSLQATVDDPHVELWMLFSESSQHSVEYLQLSLHTNWLVVLVNHHSKNMSELDYPDILLHMGLEDVSDNALEEGVVVVQLQRDVELRLEVGPHPIADDVLSVLPVQQHLFPEHRVASFSPHIVPQLIGAYVPCLGMVLAHTDLEQVLLLVVVDTVLVGQLNQEIDVRRRRQV